MSAPSSFAWFASHELRLAWRDWVAMMTAGRGQTRTLLAVLAGFAVIMHAIAFATVAGFADLTVPDKMALVVITGSVLLTASLTVSQAMESVTRAVYARSDLDLLLSSPAPASRIFAVRIISIALTSMAMTTAVAAPFINVLAIEGGPRWLAAYAAMGAIGAAAAAVATLATAALFFAIGAKRTRLVAQIMAAVIGAAFLIALQFAAILSSGTLSRFAVLTSGPLVAYAPDLDSTFWLPARAVLGNVGALAVVLAASLLLLGIAVSIAAPRLGAWAAAAAGVAGAAVRHRRRICFRAASTAALLRRKEWVLLARDPWLASQTLMQLLYLLPPAFLLWRSFGNGTGSAVLVVPVLVMAAGQLAGGLAWLTICGEDAPELIATAPLAQGRVLRAKIEAVIGAVAVVFAPLLAALAFAAPYSAGVAAAGIAAAAGAATYVQLCFRAQARRSQFRRRQTASRMATFAEAFVSIGCAGTAVLAAAGIWAAAVPAAMTMAILFGVRAVSPHRAERDPESFRTRSCETS
jgi:ABC-2 type transport system permease protein